MQIDLARIDRRIIYLMVLLALSIPLIMGFAVKPARMKAAEDFFSAIEAVPPNGLKSAFVVLDFGPNSMAENLPQSEVVIEHLFRKRIPVILYSQYALAGAFLDSIPLTVSKRLEKEMPGKTWEYGRDWVNLGYRPGTAMMIQNMAKSDNLASLLKKDSRGNNLSDLAAFRNVRTLNDIAVLSQFTSLVGTFDAFLQFFKKRDYKPVFTHGCTSITIPQAFIYLDSGQLKGLLEGIAGAAWYANLLKRENPDRATDTSLTVNTGLGVAHLVIILLIVVGNAAAFYSIRRRS